MTGNMVGGMTQGTMGIVQGVLAAVQMSKANKKLKELEKNKPIYEIPAEVYANMSAAERLAYEGMPAAQKAQFNRNIQRQQATMLARSGSLQAGLSGLAASSVASADAAGNLAVADAQMRREGEKIAMDQRGVLAQYKDKAFNIKRSDWMYDRDQAMALKGAAIQNMYGALDTGAASGATFAGGGSGGSNFSGGYKAMGADEPQTMDIIGYYDAAAQYGNRGLATGSPVINYSSVTSP